MFPFFPHLGLICWKHSFAISQDLNKVLKLDTELNRIQECVELLVGVSEDFYKNVKDLYVWR